MTHLTSANPFSKIKARYLVVIWLFPFSFILGYLGVLEKLSQKWPWYWLHIFSSYYFHVIFIIAILIVAAYSRLNWNTFFKNRITFKEFIPGLKLTVFMFFFSTALAYILFYPLSYICPQFIEIWYIGRLRSSIRMGNHI